MHRAFHVWVPRIDRRWGLKGSKALYKHYRQYAIAFGLLHHLSPDIPLLKQNTDIEGLKIAGIRSWK